MIRIRKRNIVDKKINPENVIFDISRKNLM